MAAVPSFRRRRSFHAMAGTSNRYAPTTAIALSIISTNILDLRKKQYLICEIKKSLRAKEVKCLDMEQREVLRFNDRVLDQIDVLEKLFEQFSNITTTTTTYNCPLNVITHQLQDLHQSVYLTSQAEENLRRDRFIKDAELECLFSKSVVVHCIDVLEKIYQEISLGQLPLSGAKPGRGVDETFHLNPMLSKSRGLAEIPAFQAKESHRLFEEFRPRMNEKKTREVINRVEPESLNKQRYLCVTNGFEIFCLDLKQSKDQTFNNAADVPFIPRIATLDLLEESLPIAGGLFKWRSNAYMIGGHKPSEPLEENSMGRNCYSAFNEEFCTHTIKGTSCLTYGLSLSDDATLCHSESKNIWKLKKPKAWPIVEEINGQIHVIDSAPARFDKCCPDWLFSHEVFNPDTGTWAETIVPKLSDSEDRPEDGYSEQISILSNSEHMYCIKSYLVLGNRIYAASNEASMVFNSNEKKWKAHPIWRNEDPVFLEEVWHILGRGPSRCVGRYPYGGEPGYLLYVVVALELDQILGDGNYDNYVEAVGAVAYLVTSTGKILCIQRLTHFFKGPVWPFDMSHGTIIQVDDEVEEKTMCSIVKGERLGGDGDCNYLFINTFTVEMLSDAVPMIRELLPRGSEALRMPSYIVQDFVRVHTKASYVYRMDAELGLGLDSRKWAGMRACFL